MRLNELQRECLDAVAEGLAAAGCEVERRPTGVYATLDGKVMAGYRADLRAVYVATADAEGVIRHLRGIPDIRIVWAGPTPPPPQRERPHRRRRHPIRPKAEAKPEPKPEPTPEPARVVRATVNGKPLAPSQARYLLRLSGRRWDEHPNPPTREEARELIALLLGALRDPANAEATALTVGRVRVWYPDFDRGDVRRWACGKAPAGQGRVRTRRASVRAASTIEAPPEPEPEDDATRERGEACLLAAQERLTQNQESRA
ncbi:MAG TPA: hypothetical protein PLE19_12640 [Planctomycetota bacterium]|nr:hypothetical protein [Planctomycetota bacterium]HRR83253.1 hypothetical protein [Planctomycetota bacterium]HRT97123.1 hypothetical protein [Planctomycetota bacterium]